MTALGHERRFRDAREESGLPPTSGKIAAAQRTDIEGHKQAWKRRAAERGRTNSREESYGKARLESRLVAPLQWVGTTTVSSESGWAILDMMSFHHFGGWL